VSGAVRGDRLQETTASSLMALNPSDVLCSVSASMISSIAGAQPPQLMLAAQAATTSLRVRAPLRTALRITRSVTALQWQTITSTSSSLRAGHPLRRRLDVIDRTIMKMKFKVIFLFSPFRVDSENRFIFNYLTIRADIDIPVGEQIFRDRL